MTNEDLFSDENIAESNWFKFEKVGDKISGTLMSKREAPGRDNFPDQIVYELKNDEGFYNVGIAVSKTGLHDKFRNIKMGQIVGFKFMEEIPSKTKGFNPTKVIEVFTNGTMDPTYVAEQLDGKVVEEGDEEIAVEEVPFK